LARVHQEFGDDPLIATARAAARVNEALADMRRSATGPHWSAEHPAIRPGIRTVTSKKFVFYFEIDEPSAEVRILATFFGGADHGTQIRDRFRH
jgi:plasmid stabilization system protein ParE